MGGHIDEQPLVTPAEKERHQRQMRGRTHGGELGQPLHKRQEHNLFG